MTTSDPGNLTRAIWRKSSHSNPSSNNCVEVARNLPGIVAVRDSKNPGGPALTFTPDEWKTFTANIRATALGS
jgi:Domain of unknown function (DUF397)